ncbi:major facilitator super transporter protein [Dispira parvispora]|uniref:GPI ethanolamine phosphate transferase 2 n=1 Tax=Dispira parvispora TaxID=1520584 RepID=A0A9W8AY85_9FUNG|nr:major facilitator super transporter protein [Dispira parvispora]
MRTGPWAQLLALLLVEGLGLYFFIQGFFPYKRVIPGFATPDDTQGSYDHYATGPLVNASSSVPTPYDRLVVMVVDALRYDFAFSAQASAMAFTQQLITSRRALAYIARATPPTVTMPCLKAITTGSTPNFLDAVLNIAENDPTASLATQDNWLWQFQHRRGKRMVLYGDDTWLRLFPDTFTRHDGTSSFYVSDTVEVDNNVTRHLAEEMKSTDWDVMILHYLGLDHVGHLDGPRSPLMAPKQREMDQVVEYLYTELLRSDRERMAKDPHAGPTLFVLLGDHGMNDGGNHGGNSVGETSPALVFMSSAFDGGIPKPEGTQPDDLTVYDGIPLIPIQGIIHQVDLVPTLSLLFNTPIPKNSVGTVLPDLIAAWPLSQQVQALRANAHQILDIVKFNYPQFMAYEEEWLSRDVPCDSLESSSTDPVSLERIQCYYTRATFYSTLDESAGLSRALDYYKWLIQYTSASLSRSFSSYNVPKMMWGLLGLGVALLGLWVSLGRTTQVSQAHLRNTAGSSRESESTQFVPSIATDPVGLPEARGYSGWFPSWLGTTMLVTYVIAMFGTSFVEDEQYYWYWWLSTLLFVQLFLDLQGCLAYHPAHWKRMGYSLPQLVLWRLAQQWNPAGMQLSVMLDVRSYLQHQSYGLEWFICVFTLVLICVGQTAVFWGKKGRASLAAGAVPFGQATVTVMTTSYMALLTVLHKWWVQTAITDTPLPYGVAWLYHYVAPFDPVHSMPRLVYCLYVALFLAYGGYIGMGARKQNRTVTPLLSRLALALKVWLHTTTVVLVLLNRLLNAGLFAVFYIIYVVQKCDQSRRALSRSEHPSATDQKPPVSVATSYQRIPSWVLHILATVVSFYCFGYSNTLSTIDLGNGYTGVTSYNVVLVGILTFVSNWSGPIFWGLAFTVLLLQRVIPHTPCNDTFQKNTDGISDPAVAANAVRRQLWNTIWRWVFLQAFALFVVSLVVVIQRRHLFIWSVFSPKYLYQVAWSGFSLLLSVGGWGILCLGLTVLFPTSSELAPVG